MVAHYMIFIGNAAHAIYLWIKYILARWIASHTGLHTDILINHNLPGTAPVTDDLMKGPRYREGKIFLNIHPQASLPVCPVFWYIQVHTKP